jgi:hypothetical protein
MTSPTERYQVLCIHQIDTTLNEVQSTLRTGVADVQEGFVAGLCQRLLDGLREILVSCVDGRAPDTDLIVTAFELAIGQCLPDMAHSNDIEFKRQHMAKALTQLTDVLHKYHDPLSYGWHQT